MEEARKQLEILKVYKEYKVLKNENDQLKQKLRDIREKLSSLSPILEPIRDLRVNTGDRIVPISKLIEYIDEIKNLIT